jgi:hypothetical protein
LDNKWRKGRDVWKGRVGSHVEMIAQSYLFEALGDSNPRDELSDYTET